MNDRNPRRPNDGPKRAGAPKRDARAGGPPKRDGRSSGAPKRDARAGGAPKRDGRSSGVPKRDGRSEGAPRRDARAGGAPKRDGRSTGAPKRASRGAGAAKRVVRSDGTPRRPPRAGGSASRESRPEGGRNREMRRDGPQKRTARTGAVKRAGGGAKRTSRSSDDRNPTRSSVDYPTPKFRRKNEEPAPVAASPRPSLRKVRRPEPKAPAARPTRERKTRGPVSTTRRRKLRKTEAGDELARIAGRGARHAQTELARAAEAFTAGRERDAARLLRPLRDAYPDASAVRELLGLCQYRLGQYAAATKELDAFVELTNSVEQHPVLMDCARALGKHRRVEELWEELAAASPAGALVAEGRIVLAGDLADQGRLTEAIAILDRRGGQPNRVQEHHIRVWYALADLSERAGDLPRARDLFLQIRRYDASFADAAERLAALG